VGFFTGLDTEGYDRQYSDRTLIRRLAGYFRPQTGRLVWIVVGLLIVSLASAGSPLLVGRAVDTLQTALDASAIALISLAVLLLGVIDWLANWVRSRLTTRTIGDVVLDLRSDAFRAAARHDLRFYEEFSSGKIVTRISSDTNEFAQVVVLVTEVISQFGQAIILSFFLFSINWRMTLLLYAFLPFVFLVAVGFRGLARRTTRHGMRAMGNVNAAIKETISGIAVAKNFRQEAEIYREFDESNRQSYQTNIKRGLVLSLVFPVLNVINFSGMALLVYVGGLQVSQAVITAGAWYLFLLSLERFWFPVLNLSAFWTQIQAGLSAAERVFALMDAEAHVNQIAQHPVPPLRGDIRFVDLSFRYTDKEQVLERFNLHVRPGETLALVGHTGSGKSSIARLIARFYEFQSGQLLIDGQDIRTLDLQQYRRRLGIVNQVPFLFSGTVIENIRFSCPDASAAQIEGLARKIGDGEWLETLPNGLETEVGERGSRLSLGQRQLVALLRVLVQDPAIFILDEATASIDPFTEWQIQQGLNIILKHTTSILIAHRLSTIKAADRIIVLRHGQILEEGNHTSLLAGGGHYAELYNTYFRHQSLSYVDEVRAMADQAR